MRVAGFLWDAFVLHVGELAVTDMHAVASVQLLLGFGQPVVVRTDDGRTIEAESIVVRPSARHAFQCGPFAMLWIEPESDAGRRLTEAYCRRRPLSPVEVPGRGALARRATAILDAPGSCDAAWRFSMDVLGSLAAELPRGRPVHPAMRKTLRVIEASPHSKVSAEALATEVGLSKGRLTHLFRETMGVPLRRWLMWQRLRRAVVVLTRGGSATEAAHEAGFTDTAHLNRVLKMMLGVRPSDLQAIRSSAGLTLRVCARPRSTS
jgi:AraC-like DNA-binding protein